MPTADVIRSQIGFFNSVSGIRQPAFAVINAVQDAAPADQILAVATALTAMATAIGLDPHDLIQKIDRARRHIDGPFQTHFKAIEAYAKGELTS
jgi:hypothetical protein